jgi:DNA polymerase II small subunit/DNA polymerase delta subunit B
MIIKQINYKNFYLVHHSPTNFVIDDVYIFFTFINVFEKYTKILNKNLEQTVFSLLKKRHLDPIVDSTNIRPEDNYLLDPIPDLIITQSTNPQYFNYKGTTVLFTGNFINNPNFWEINLKTREIFKISFT